MRGRKTELAKLPLVFQHCGYWEELETVATEDVFHSAPGTTISQSLPGIGSKMPGCLHPQMLLPVSSGSAFAWNPLISLWYDTF